MKVVKFCLMLILIQTQPAFAGSTGFEQAVQNYKARKFPQALAGFRNELRSRPSDPMTHYYMALCYQGMNQISLAKQEYQIVMAGNDPRLKNYAASGLTQLGQYKSTYSGYSGSSSKSTLASASGSSGAAPKIVGRLKVLEFYTDW